MKQAERPTRNREKEDQGRTQRRRTIEMPKTLRWLITSSILYVVIALMAAFVAITENLPAQPLGESSGSGSPVWQDFLYGSGTAMSPGLPWLIAQAILTWFASRKGRWGTIGVAGLTLFGLLSGVFALAEPIVRRIFHPATFDLLKAVIETGIIVLPFVMMALGSLELARRWRQR